MKTTFRTALLVASVALFAACGSSKAPEGTKKTSPTAKTDKSAEQKAPTTKKATKAAPVVTQKVDLWHTYRGAEKKALHQAIADFNKSQKAVDLTVKAVPYDGFLDKLRITIGANRGPDLFIFAHNKLGPWTKNGMVAPLTDDITGEELDTFDPIAVKALVYQKSLYGLPLALKPLALFYNKALLPTVPDSMEALIPELKNRQKKDLHGLAYDAGLLFFHAQWIHAFGGKLLDKNLTPHIDSKPQAQAMAFARSLHQEHKILPTGLNGHALTSFFNKGKVIAVISGPWFRGEIAPELKVGLTPIPSLAGKAARPFLSVEGIFVSSKSKVKAAALKAARYLAGPKSAQVRLTVGKQTVAHSGVLKGSKDELVKVFHQAAQNAVIMDARPEFDEVWAPMNSALASGIFGKKGNLQALLKRAQDKVVTALHKQGK